MLRPGEACSALRGGMQGSVSEKLARPFAGRIRKGVCRGCVPVYGAAGQGEAGDFPEAGGGGTVSLPGGRDAPRSGSGRFSSQEGVFTRGRRRGVSYGKREGWGEGFLRKEGGRVLCVSAGARKG